MDTALNYAKQIVEALEAAHEKGITQSGFEACERGDHSIGHGKGARLRFGEGCGKGNTGSSRRYLDDARFH
jgi:hypothetical protein